MSTRARRAATKAPIVIESDTESEPEDSDPEGIFSSPDQPKKVKRAPKRPRAAGSDDSDFDESKVAELKHPVKRKALVKEAESPAKKPKAEPKPKAVRKPREPKAPKAPKEPKAPKVPKEPKAPKAPKAPRTTTGVKRSRKKAETAPEEPTEESVTEVKIEEKPEDVKMPLDSSLEIMAPELTIKPEPVPVKHEIADEVDTRPKYKKRVSMTVRDQWDDYELLAEMQNIDRRTARTIIKLFEEENTIPFICRYRKELIGDMTPDDLRDVKLAYNQILSIKSKADTIIKNLEKEEKLTEDIKQDLLCAKSIDELDHMYAPFKPANKGSLADRAKALGLDSFAEGILIGSLPEIDLPELVKPEVEGLETVEKVEEGIKHLMAHNFSKNTAVLEEIRRLISKYDIVLSSTQITKSRKAEEKDESNNNGKGAGGMKRIPKKVDEHKFEHYFSFTCCTKYLRPHQIMALNRGENQKVLSIKLQFKDNVKGDLYWFLKKEYLQEGTASRKRTELFEASFDEAFTKKLVPLMSRTVRSELTKRAEKASVEVFANNLKQLLLTAPVKGEKILGIDPGFSNGCKLALISECGDLLDTATIYPHIGGERSKVAPGILANMMRKHSCALIALGNGTACRETESMLSYMMEEGILDKRFVRYSIVPEQGASIYSCSEVAKKEFPKMDVNLISAVSIARRLQDPLCEYVKIEPKHLGVGMYQHDINEKSLSETLDEVVMECVSFVGVDINTASVSLLSHVSGLTAKRAEHIVSHRTKNGPFRSREQLLKVKFIGDKTFTQCAGFIRIEPLTAGIRDYNLLDSTWVHPESYALAESIITKAGLSNKDIGRVDFILGIRDFAYRTPKSALPGMFNQTIERIECVLSALQRELLRDYRADINKPPMFKKGLTSMSDLAEGTVLTGAVNNVTDFGAFVDIGVENNGLIHRSKMNGMRVNIGDQVEVTVLSIDVGKGRLGLKLEKIL
ncbi:AAEL004243-PA [Aedes aegypti]|uniref:AAEL004243-PA n=1 Tax=Aedes aegypti TaxID=7159 RepID=Q17DE1_AEDAE|nr:AAEL004243-PA [Aedes aegypti]